ncbi:MAG: cob(I)yrinic acid a,c-diamide adenosyltransferase [bacterium]
MSIYTKTGDQGKTSLLGGERTTKDCISLQVVGALDELNAVLGLVVSCCHSDHSVIPTEATERIEVEGSCVNFIQQIQKDLFKIGAEIASLQMTDPAKPTNMINIDQVQVLEKQIDQMCAQLPELNSFILPGGSLAGAHLHLARTVCRRTERKLVALGKQKQVRDELYMYLNRLSDYLFTVARWVNWKAEQEEVKYS